MNELKVTHPYGRRALRYEDKSRIASAAHPVRNAISLP
jgi:hypothetical protein